MITRRRIFTGTLVLLILWGAFQFAQGRARFARIRTTVAEFIVSIHDGSELSKRLWPSDMSGQLPSIRKRTTRDFEITSVEESKDRGFYQFGVRFKNGQTGAVYITVESDEVASARLQLGAPPSTGRGAVEPTASLRLQDR